MKVWSIGLTEAELLRCWSKSPKSGNPMMMMTIKQMFFTHCETLFFFVCFFWQIWSPALVPHFGAICGGSVLINKIEDKTNVEKN